MRNWNLQNLFCKYRGDLLRFLKRRITSPDTREDVVQEAFLHLLSATPAAPVHHVKAYLFKTADNLAIDYLRRERTRRDHFIAADDYDRHPCEKPGADTVLDYRERVQILSRAISELPPKCRAVFLLHKFDGLSHSEIAARLGISRSMVEKHVMKAMLHCRDRLDGLD